MRIGIVAGEASGDILGAGLMTALRRRIPDVTFDGVGGERMAAAGCQLLFPSEKLAVMGLVEVLGHLPELLRVRRSLVRHFATRPPDVFIGVDAPDFNLGLERALKARGIPTVHYVSPSVWAWRRYRVRKIAKSVDLMLTLLPFEARFYEEHHVPVQFVGHPLADELPWDPDRDAARRALGLAAGPDPLIALLPGSRMGEVTRLADDFIATAHWCAQRRPDVRFVLPAATAAIREFLATRVAGVSSLTVTAGQSHLAIAAADVVLVASGTATLECLLSNRPMVVAYRLAPATFWLAKRLVKVSYFSLPNLLAGRRLVPEFVQDQVTADRLGPTLLDLLAEADRRSLLAAEFRHIQRELRREASEQAAAAVLRQVA